MAIEAKTAVPSAAANGKHGQTLISDAKFRQLYEVALCLKLLVGKANGSGRNLSQRGAALASLTADMEASDTLVAALDPSVAAWLRTTLPCTINAAKTSSPDHQIVDAVTAAAVDRLRGNGRVAVLFASEETRMLREAHGMAAAAKLPILFVESESARNPSAERQSDSGVADNSSMPVIPVDSQDVIALYRVAHESMSRARLGSGPTRIVCVQMTPATGEPQKQSPRRTDAVSHLEQWLEARGLPAHEWRQEIVAGFETRG